MNYNVAKLENLLHGLQDETLDQYNEGNISKKEMINIMDWINGIIEMKRENPNAKIRPMGFKGE